MLDAGCSLKLLDTRKFVIDGLFADRSRRSNVQTTWVASVSNWPHADPRLDSARSCGSIYAKGINRPISAAQYRAGLMSLPKVQLPFATYPRDPYAG